MSMDILKSKCEDLFVKEMKINKNLNMAAVQGLRPREQVLLWLARVSTVKVQVNNIESSVEEKSTKCLNNRHPHKKHLKMIREIIKKVEQLQETSSFPEGLVISGELFDEQLPDMLSLMAAPKLVGDSIKNTLNEVWEHIMDPEVGIIGIYGMGGVDSDSGSEDVEEEVPLAVPANGKPEPEAEKSKVVAAKAKAAKPATKAKDAKPDDDSDEGSDEEDDDSEEDSSDDENNIAVQLRVHLPINEDDMSRAAVQL